MPSTDPTHPQPRFIDDFEARFVARALRRHGVVIFVAVVVGVLAGVGFRLLSPPVYRAEAVLLVNIQSIKIGADGIPMDVEMVLPARRLVGTVCNSDRAMSMLAKRLGTAADDGTNPGLSSRIASLRGQLYYDQRGLEMAALRAVAPAPDEAARLANEWAQVSQILLREAYGTTAKDVREIQQRAEVVKQQVLLATQALEQLKVDADAAQRLERLDKLDRLQKLLGALNERWAQLRVRQEDSEQIARIVSPATPPAEPINPSVRLIAGLFAFAGLFIGLAIALLRGPAPGVTAPGVTGGRG